MMKMDKSVQEILKQQLTDCAVQTEAAMEAYFASLAEQDRTGLTEAMKYSAMAGGKRLRPFLVVSFAQLFGGSADLAMPFACAIEMIHTYSLIHDDLPCMDNDTLRRGKPTNHVVYGEAQALLAGDALLTHAFEMCASNDAVSDKSVRLAVLKLASLAGVPGMAGGQALDLDEKAGVSMEELAEIHRMKTGALFCAAALMGYYSACDEPDSAIEANLICYGEKLGRAFQIRDDILDVLSDEATLGKNIGSDSKNDKKTALTFMTVEEAEAEVGRLTEEAVTAISAYEGSKILIALAHMLAARKK